MKRKRHLSAPVEESSGAEAVASNIVNLIDVVFVLLIFFVLASTFSKDAGVDIKKPNAQSASEIKDKNVQIAITKEGSIYVEQKQVDLEVLESLLRRQKSLSPTIKAVIVADNTSMTGVLVKVIDKCNLAGIRDVSIAALKE